MMLGVKRLTIPLILVIAAGCRTVPTAESSERHNACQLAGSPVVVHADGDAIEQYWELADTPALWSTLTPASEAYETFRSEVASRVPDLDPRWLLRRTYEDAGAPSDDDERKQRYNNREIAEGRVGTLREISCIEAALFAYQAQRFSMIDQPTEFHGVFVTTTAGDTPRLRVYFAASAELFPPKPIHIMERVESDVAAGWTLSAHLHDHTWHFDAADGAADTLAVTAPSTPDVHYYRALRERLGLERALVTNGFHTIELDAADFDVLEARE